MQTGKNIIWINAKENIPSEKTTGATPEKQKKIARRSHHLEKRVERTFFQKDTVDFKTATQCIIELQVWWTEIKTMKAFILLLLILLKPII